MHIRAFQSGDKDAVIALWASCQLLRAGINPAKDIERKLAMNPEMLLVGEHEGQIVATVMVGDEGRRGWINYLAVSPACRRRGWGRQMVDAAEQLLRRRNCPKVNLQVRTTNREVIAFYKHIGFSVDDVISLGKRLEPDRQPPEAG